MKTSRPFALLFGTGIIVAMTAFAVRTWLQARGASQTLADGSRLTLMDVQLGKTNTFSIGNSWERTLGQFAPSNGVNLLGFKLRRPLRLTMNSSSDGPSLCLLFRLTTMSNSSNSLIDRSLNAPQLRLVVRAASDHEYEGYLGDFGRIRSRSNWYALGQLTAFPRDEKWLKIRVVGDREGEREEVAQFRIKNPRVVTETPWKAERAPVHRTFDDFEMTLGEITMGPRCWRIPTNADETGSIPLRILENKIVMTNWTLHEIRARDGLGNYEAISSFPIASNGWAYHALWGGLDPTRVWKLEAHLSKSQTYQARAEDFAPSELFTVRLMGPLFRTFQTNFANVPLEFKPWNTGVEVTMLTKRSDLRVSFVSATDSEGNRFKNPSGNWEQWRFARNFDMNGAKVQADVTFAIHRDYYFECFVQPRRKEVKP